MSQQRYRKAVVARFGEDPKECIEIVEDTLTDPGPNELLVKNHCAGVNFADVPLMMGQSHSYPQPPFDFGIEAAGEVVAVGSKVADFKVGETVVTAFWENGYREYALIDARLAFKVPEATPEWLGLVISGASASIALDVTARMRSGLTVLVTAALGVSGHYAVQLAKLAGNHVIGTCRNAREAELLKQLDCDRLINREEEDLASVLPDEYPAGINLAIDSFGGDVFNICIDNVAPRGRVVSTGALVEHIRHEGHVHLIDVYNKLISKSATLHGFSLIEYAQFIPNHVHKLFELYEQGKLKTLLDPVEFHGIESVPDAIEHILDLESIGKVVVKL